MEAGKVGLGTTYAIRMVGGSITYGTIVGFGHGTSEGLPVFDYRSDHPEADPRSLHWCRTDQIVEEVPTGSYLGDDGKMVPGVVAVAPGVALRIGLHEKIRASFPKWKLAIRDKARLMHCTESDDIQIDDDADVTAVDEGVWVAAFVFVPNHEIETDPTAR